MPHLYFAPWEWVLDDDEAFGGYWAAPNRADCLACQDWRPLTAQGIPVVASGMGLFAYPTPVALGTNLYLGDDPLAVVRPAQRAALATFLGVPGALPSGNLMELLHYLNTEENDPTGLTRWSGRRMTRQGIGVSLPGFGELARYAYDEAHPAWNTTLVKFQTAYQRRKAAGASLDALQRYTGATMLGLVGRMDTAQAERLLPEGHQGDGFRRPTSTYGDTFTDSNGTDLTAHTPTGSNPGTGWTVTEGTGNGAEIQGNEARAITGSETIHMTLDDALSSDAMDAQAVIVTVDEPDSGQNTNGVVVRATADTTITNYYTRFEHVEGAGSGTWNVEFGQRVTGTKTNFGGNDDRGDPGLPVTYKLSVNADASTIEVFIDEVSETSGDDSASEIGVGNVNGGFTLFNRPGGTGVAQTEVDDFLTTDNLGGGADELMAARQVGGLQPVQMATQIIAY